MDLDRAFCTDDSGAFHIILKDKVCRMNVALEDVLLYIILFRPTCIASGGFVNVPWKCIGYLLFRCILKKMLPKPEFSGFSEFVSQIILRRQDLFPDVGVDNAFLYGFANARELWNRARLAIGLPEDVMIEEAIPRDVDMEENSDGCALVTGIILSILEFSCSILLEFSYIISIK